MKIKTLLFLSIIILTVSCQKDPSTKESSKNVATQLQKKWMLPSGNNLNYSWIEFAPGSNYIIKLQTEISKSGKYSLSADEKTVILTNLGTLEITTLTDNSFNFSMRLTGSTTPINASGIAAAQKTASANTDLLCQDWNLYKTHEYQGFGIYDTIIYPQIFQNSEGTINMHIIFSSYGTYFGTDIEKTPTGADTLYSNGTWSWINQAQTSFKANISNDSGIINIEELTKSSLRIRNEDSTIHFLNR